MLSESTGSSFLIYLSSWQHAGSSPVLLMCRFLNNNLLTGEVPAWILESKNALWVYCEAIHDSLYMKYTNLCSPQSTTRLPCHEILFQGSILQQFYWVSSVNSVKLSTATSVGIIFSRYLFLLFCLKLIANFYFEIM